MPLLDLVGSILSAGDKPVVPDYNEVNIGEEQKKAVQGNLGMVPDLSNLAAGVNASNRKETRLNMDQIKAMLKEAIPDLDAINQQASSNILSGLKGELPKSVQDLLENKANARSFSGGFGQSGMGKNMGLRDLGIASLDMTNRSLDSASRWISMSRQSQTLDSPMFDMSSMFLTPAQRYAAQTNEREFKFGRDWMQAKIDAAPDPTMAAVGQWMQRTDQSMQSMVGSVAGGMVGGMMGGGGGGGGGSKGTQYNQTPSYMMMDGPKGGWSNSSDGPYV